MKIKGKLLLAVIPILALAAGLTIYFLLSAKQTTNADKESVSGQNGGVTTMSIVKEAMAAREKSYSPYSEFRVGAALECSDGTIYRGCNIENASYSPTNCAERTAFFKAVSEGRRDFLRIAIVGGKDGEEARPTPCGVCLQVMAEFCDPETFEVWMATSETDVVKKKLGELLPYGFSLK